MKTRLLLLIPATALAVAGVLAVAAWTRGASGAPPTPAAPAPTVAATATTVRATATTAPSATSAASPTSAPSATATRAQTAPPAATALPSPTATTVVLPSPTVASPAPTPSAPVSPPPVAPTVAPPAPPRIATSSASLAVNGQTLSYSYPSGWSLKQSTKNQQTVTTIEGPEGAFVSLTVYGADSAPAQLSAAMLETLKKQFGAVSSTPLATTVGGLPAEGYTVRFTAGGIPTTGAILSLRGGRSAVTLYTQAADADLSVMQARFDVVKNTLVVR